MTDTEITPVSDLAILRSRLTDLQARFAEEYMIDLNGSEAAIRAGSKHSRPRQAAYEFMTNHDVMAYIDAMRADRRRQSAMTAERLLEMLREEAEADTADLYDSEGNIRPVHEWPMAFRRGLVVGIEVNTEYESDGDGGARDLGKVAKIKIADRKGIKELIGRHIGVQAFKENVTLSGAIGVAAIPVDQLTEEQLKVIASIPTKVEAQK